VKRDRQPKQARVEKEKTDHADKCFAVFEIDLGAGRDKRREDARIDSVIEHSQITLVGEKRLHRNEASLQTFNAQRPLAMDCLFLCKNCCASESEKTAASLATERRCLNGVLHFIEQAAGIES
jgi:hypothetical protein